jgi:hypothetical protein
MIRIVLATTILIASAAASFGGEVFSGNGSGEPATSAR